MKNKNKIVVSLLFVLAAINLTGCGKKAPDEKALKEMLPSEIIEYSIDENFYISNIKNLDIERRQTNDKSDVADCIVKLEDDISDRIVYLSISSKYYDKGGWQINDWYMTGVEEITLKETPDADVIEPEILSREYVNIKKNDDLSVVSPQYVENVYTVEDKYKYCTISGNITANKSLVSYSESYPMQYHWQTTVDDSQMDVKWDIEGTWYGEHDYYFTIDILSLTEESLSWMAKAEYDTTTGGIGSYDVEEPVVDNYEVTGNTYSTLQLEFGGSIVYPGFTVMIYPDEGIIGDGWKPEDSNSPFERQE